MKFIFPCVIETKSIHANNFNYCTNDYLQTELPALFSFICGIIPLWIIRLLTYLGTKRKILLLPREHFSNDTDIFEYFIFKDSCVISTAY